MKISASLYSSKDVALKDLVEELDQHKIDFFHIDSRDDESVFDDIAKIRTYSSTPIDLHLISANPEKYFDRINELKVDHVTLQFEDLNGYEYTGGLNSDMGLSIVSNTPISALEGQFEHYDFILFMATTPGESGGQFDKINFRKIREFRKMFPGKSIHVDGGVNDGVSFILRNMGVRVSVVGSYLFRDQSVGAALLNLKTHEIDSHFQVADFMRTRTEIPLLNRSQRGLKDVLQSIEEHKLGFTILEDEQNQLEGIVSNADLRRELLAHVDNPSDITVESMINRNPISVNETSTVEDMLKQIRQFTFPINYLPVVDSNNRVTGVVSFLNLVKGEL